jgi:hypothetical protein
MTTAGDKIEGELRPKYAAWYATQATAGVTALHLREPAGQRELWIDIAEQAQFVKIILLPEVISGIEMDIIGGGQLLVCFKGGDEGGPLS